MRIPKPWVGFLVATHDLVYSGTTRMACIAVIGELRYDDCLQKVGRSVLQIVTPASFHQLVRSQARDSVECNDVGF